eukprot:114919_1
MGDVAYTDADYHKGGESNLQTVKAMFDKQRNLGNYSNFRHSVNITGVWDDHDYAYENAGEEVPDKVHRQEAFLNFLDEPEESIRRNSEGIYMRQNFNYDSPT